MNSKIILNYLDRNILKNSVYLFFGVVLSHLITLGILPILTRLFNQEQFGFFAIYISVFSVYTTIISARYEYGIVSTKIAKHAKGLVSICILIALIMSLVFYVIYLATPLNKYFSLQDHTYLLYVLLIVFFAQAVYQASDFWLNRNKRYIIMSINRVQMAFFIGLFQIIFSYFSLIGLVIGDIVGRVVTAISVFLNSKIRPPKLNKIKSIALLRRYREFPLFQAPTALLNAISSNSPIFFIGFFYGVEFAGAYILVVRVLGAPVALLSQSIGKVLFQKISDSYRNSSETIFRDFVVFSIILAIISFFFCMPIFLYGDIIFGYIFGSEWFVAGEYAKILSIAFFATICVSPLTLILIAIDKIKVLSIWQIFHFFLTIIILFIGSHFNFKIFLYLYSINQVFIYLLCIILIGYQIRKISKDELSN